MSLSKLLSIKINLVFSRGHQVLRLSLPPKREYVLLIRMTSYQRKLYRLFMEELINHRSVSNPLRAFAICCKIWNHPDVLYNFVRELNGFISFIFFVKRIIWFLLSIMKHIFNNYLRLVQRNKKLF
jgi:hypothetical protein